MAFRSRDTTNGVGTRLLRPSEPDMAREVRYIQKRAQQREARIVVIRDLLLFSTETGDAWMLDRDDQLAARVAHDGVPEQIYIRESNTRFAIRWKGDYRLDGPNFFYSDCASRRVIVIAGYPMAQIAQADHSATARGEGGP